MSRAPAIALTGGLDLTTPAPLARPGTLADCENYEVGSRVGYTRVDGFERFDGRPGVAEFRCLRLSISGISGSFSLRDRIIFATGMPALGHQGVDGYIASISQSGSSATISVIFAGGMSDPIVPDTITNQTGTGSANCTAFESLSVPDGEQQDFDYALLQLATSRRAEIETVPGRAGSDVLGGFLFKNNVYAIRDLPRVNFEGGYYTDSDEGLHITIDLVEYKILDVVVLGEQSGYVVYDPVPASGTDAVGIDSPTLASLPLSGSLSSGFVGIPYSDGLSVSGGVAPYFWSLAESDTGAPAPPEPGDLSEVTLQSEVTPAALWRATSTGWSRVDLGREMAFTGGTSFLRNTPRALSLDAADVKTSAWLFPTTSTINTVSAPNINADDGTTASLGGADGQTVLCKGFSFTSIPAGAQILGIEVRIERQSNVGNKAFDGAVILTGVSGGVQNKAAGEWPTALTLATYGGADDLWGSENITRDVLGDPEFGVMFLVRRSNPANAIVATIDHVSIRVTYAERAGMPAFLWDGTSDVPVTIINVQALSGDFGASSAAGYITMTAAVNSAKPRLVKVGDQIRSAAAGGGNLLGVVASRDRPIFLPGQFEVDNNRSAYRWEQYNFFGEDRYTSMYGVSGAGPAMSFDGTNAIKIRVPLSPGQDVPRHIAKHGTMLALGYFSGAVIFSAVGEPTEMRAAFGAAAIEVGDRLTALAPGGGDALTIVCEASTYVLRGLSQSVFTQNTVSARRGAIEYTLADPGKTIIADSFGLFIADSPESFEPANRQYMSEPVQPWLRERLQATISNEQRFLRPVAALAVRSKNQYRLYFRDGRVLTMTMSNAGIEITKQRLYSGSEGLVVRNIWTGIDASGRERIFCSFNAAKQGYVFEADVGRSFDGEAVSAFFVLNPYNAGSISQDKVIDRWFFGGTGGYASLQWSVGVDGKYPDGGQQQADLGRASDDSTPQNGSRRAAKMGSVDRPAEGKDFLLRVDSLTDSEAPHSLQYIEPFMEARGDSRGNRGN